MLTVIWHTFHTWHFSWYSQGVDHGAPLGDQGQGLQAPVAAVRQGPVTQTGPQTLGQVVVTEAPGVGEAPGGLVQVLAPALYVGADPGHQGGQDEAEDQGGHHQGQWGGGGNQTMVTITGWCQLPMVTTSRLCSLQVTREEDNGGCFSKYCSSLYLK